MLDDDRFLTMCELTKRYQITRASLNKWIKAGRFPLGVHFGRAHRWPLSQIREWEAARISEAAI